MSTCLEAEGVSGDFEVDEFIKARAGDMWRIIAEGETRTMQKSSMLQLKALTDFAVNETIRRF